jgi:hypothetical protein
MRESPADFNMPEGLKATALNSVSPEHSSATLPALAIDRMP